MSFGKLFAFLPALLILLTACQTDYRTNAAERARAYALKYSRDLPESDRNFIRYNDPVLMSDLLFSYRQPTFSSLDAGPNRYDSWGIRKTNIYDYMHTAFVWHLPKSGFSLVVDGAGERTQRGWTPTQVLYKRFVPENTAFSAAKLKAVNFIANFFPDLTSEEINEIRFNEPVVSATAFLLTAQENPNRDSQVQKWMNYIRSGNGTDSKAKTQISLIWTSPVNGKKMIVTGEAPKKNLYGWKPVKAYLLDPKELEESTLNEKIPLKDPQNEEGEILITPKDEADPLIVEPAFHQMQNQPR